eukprot:XP_011425264.1 PREDICTED: E3 ubiquitin-protein ligase TRIM63-like [Crassostrea gigas]
MDPRNSAQDVIRCDLCEIPLPPLYCAICHINLCKVCVGEHLLDESKLHIVVPFKHRQSTPSYPKCQEHTTKLCELHCEQCGIPVCVQCVSSKKHKAHDVEDILSYLEGRNKALQADLEELGKLIYPKYQEIASSFPAQRVDLQRNTEELISAVNKRGDDWHREIDNIIRKLKSDIKETESEHLAFLKKQEYEINQTILEITHNIGELKELLDSNDIYLLSTYKSKNAELSKLPPKFIFTFPCFSSQRIDTEQLLRQFGSLTPLSRSPECISLDDLDQRIAHSTTDVGLFDYDDEFHTRNCALERVERCSNIEDDILIC